MDRETKSGLPSRRGCQREEEIWPHGKTWTSWSRRCVEWGITEAFRGGEWYDSGLISLKIRLEAGKGMPHNKTEKTERKRETLWSGRDTVGAFCFYSGKWIGKDRSCRHYMSRPYMTIWLGKWLISHWALPWPLYGKSPQLLTHTTPCLFSNSSFS